MITAFLFKNTEEEEDYKERQRKKLFEKQEKEFFLPRDTFEESPQKGGWFQNNT
jgi:hypothetical protein